MPLTAALMAPSYTDERIMLARAASVAGLKATVWAAKGPPFTWKLAALLPSSQLRPSMVAALPFTFRARKKVELAGVEPGVVVGGVVGVVVGAAATLTVAVLEVVAAPALLVARAVRLSEPAAVGV